MIIICYSLKVHEHTPNIIESLGQRAGLAGDYAFHQDLPGSSPQLALTDLFSQVEKTTSVIIL